MIRFANIILYYVILHFITRKELQLVVFHLGWLRFNTNIHEFSRSPVSCTCTCSRLLDSLIHFFPFADGEPTQ